MSRMATLYRNGRVYSPAHPFATSMLVVGDRVAWVGADEAAPDASAVIELDDALVTPAFVDSHVHLTETALSHDRLDLTRVAIWTR